ncbi:aminopeptidase C [Actinomyces minihominis]|uniref:aminopeptidase C n=1 Tax=Actinomyces minihominis TaxID=2002838 RepID=UPI000C06AD38|nr:C1 family peptidase [Actinomyces minihominis]
MQITNDDIERMRTGYKDKTGQHIAQRAVTKNGILESTQNLEVIEDHPFVYSIDIDSEAVANQAQSGRCWMFAALNLLRLHIEKSLKLPKGTFQLSQNYSYFYDKIEKANFFHQAIIDTALDDINDRKVTFLVQTPQQDGGDWDLIAAIIKKYGVVPKTAMDETSSSINSAELNTVLNRKLRQDAQKLREMVRSEASEEEITAARRGMLDDVYSIVSVALGTPPETFDFEYRDTDKNYHGDFGLTALEFYDKYVPVDLEDYVGIINVPIDSMPYGKLYGIDLSNEIIKGRPNRYINVDMETMKKLAIEQLKAGQPVWFGSDVLQSSDIHKGVMAMGLYGLDEAFGFEFTQDKGERFLYRESLPTHAMVIGGVDLVDDKPTRWKVENSWGANVDGQKVGNNGYFVMGDDWMDQFTYEVVIHKDHLGDELLSVLDTEPIILPFWTTFNPL